MTGPKGNTEFCFLETFYAEVKAKQNSLFPAGPVIFTLVFCYTSQLKNRKKKNRKKTAKKSFASRLPTAHKFIAVLRSKT